MHLFAGRPRHRRRLAPEERLAATARAPGRLPRVETTAITVGTLHLRPWEAGDEAALVRALDDPEIARWTTLRPAGIAAGPAMP